MSSRPLLSIVLPTIGRSRYIESSIASCLDQSFEDLELLVVDGGTGDETAELVGALADDRVRLIRQQDNAGRLPAALNTGFAAARGTYLTWTQDDDLYGSDALRVMADALHADARAGMVYTGQVFIDGAGATIREGSRLPPSALAWTNPIGHCFMYRRSVAELVGEYDVRFLMAEDLHYWLRVYRHVPIVPLPGIHFSHRLHTGSLTCSQYGAYSALRVAARARREVLGLETRIYRRQVADAWVEEAFASAQRREGAHGCRCLLNAASSSPTSIVRQGVAALAIRSLITALRR